MCCTATHRPMVAMIGTDSGMMIWSRMRKNEAPSIMADSSSESGMVMMKLRMISRL